MSSLRNPFYAQPPEEPPPPRSSFGVHTGDPERPRRSSSGGVWLAVILLALGLAAMWRYGQLSLDTQNAQLAQLPSLREASESMKKLISGAQNEIATWANETENLRKRFNKIERTVAQNLKSTQAYARDLVDQIGQLRAETDAKTGALETRLNTLEAQQAAQQARLTAVEQQVQEELKSLRTDTQKDVNGLAQRISGNDRQVELLDARTTPQRVDFQLPRGRPVEMVPGISVLVRKVQVNRQQFDARVNLLAEKHSLSVVNHGAYQPVRFTSKKNHQAYELVVTDVGKDFVVGYVILPAQAGELRADSTTGARAEKVTPAPEKP